MSSITLHMFEVSLCFCLSLNNSFGASPKNMNVFSLHPDRDSHYQEHKSQAGFDTGFFARGGETIFLKKNLDIFGQQNR